MTVRAPRSLPDQVFAEARERILSGRLPADTPIRQDALALELGVSKIPCAGPWRGWRATVWWCRTPTAASS